MTVDGVVSALSLSILLWVARLYINSRNVWYDLKWIIPFGLWMERDSLWNLRTPTERLLDRSISLWAFVIAIVLSLSILYIHLHSFGEEVIETSERAEDEHLLGTGFLKPLVFPARTTHTRFFPRKHSFSYSYLLVGVPVGWHRITGSFLSVDDDITSKSASRMKAWFSVKAEDYLHRGYDPRGLRGKLESFLETQVRSVLVPFYIAKHNISEYHFR